MEKVKTILRFVLGVPLTILAFAFIGKFIYNSRDQLLTSLTNFDPIGIAIGVVFFLLFFFFRSLLWKAVLNEDGYHPSTMESTYLLAMSELRRYIPGSVLAIVGRVNTFSTYKIPSKTILKMILYESVLFLLASITLSIPAAVYLFYNAAIDMQIVLFVIFAIILICLGILAFAKKRARNVLFDLPKYTKAFLLSCTAWAFFGLGNYLILNSFVRLDPSNIIAYISFFVLSWFIGYVTVIAPLGLGVREGFLTYELSFSIPLGIAAALSVICRIAFVFCEVLFVALVYFIHKHYRPRPKIDAIDAILWGIIASYTLYFIYVNLLQNQDVLPTALVVLQTVVLGLGSFFVYETCMKVIGNKSLSLIFAASYLLNPIIQVSNLRTWDTMYLVNEAAVIGMYAVVIIILGKIFGTGNKFLNVRFFCVVVLILSVILTYFYGVLPGSAHPYITPFIK